MRISTYNLWDSPAGIPVRHNHILETLQSVQADILCLQEVPDMDMLQTAAEGCGYLHICFHPDAGTAILTKNPYRTAWKHPYASSVTIPWDGCTWQIVSVHLPWKSALEREKAIVQITRRTLEETAEYTILAGDFNCSDTSDVHRFLTGDCSLDGHDAYYFDLALAHHVHTGKTPAATLDFRHNPRWGTYEPVNTIEIPQRYDRIYLANPYPNPLPVLQDSGIFGTEIYPDTGLCPSDHYGMYADLQF